MFLLGCRYIQYKNGRKRPHLIAFTSPFLSKPLKKTGGKADPNLPNQILIQKLNG